MKTTGWDENVDLKSVQSTDRNDPRTMECDEWARSEASRLLDAEPSCLVELIRIEVNKSLRAGGAKFIGPLRLPTGRYYSPIPGWAYHYAVLSDGVARDELYPNGLPFETYKRIFQYWDCLVFISHVVPAAT